MWNNYEFHNAEFLWLLLLIPAIVVWYWFKHNKSHASLHISNLDAFKNIPVSYKTIGRHFLLAFRLLGISFLILAMARPQTNLNRQEISTEGIDIVLATDISASMLAKDFSPNRLEVAKEVAKEFIDNRPTDRMGLVIFSGESFTQCPLTTDHHVLKGLFKDIKIGMMKNGTAIGMGLATAINRLKESKAKSKVIILLTDGVNNTGSIAPLTAAEIAKTFNIRTYTIGIGSMGTAPTPVAKYPNGKFLYKDLPVEIDEDVLQQISQLTDGMYFRATDKDGLRNIYKEIDKMEKSKIQVTDIERKKEEFFWFAVIGGLLILLEIILRYTIFKLIP